MSCIYIQLFFNAYKFAYKDNFKKLKLGINIRNIWC